MIAHLPATEALASPPAIIATAPRATGSRLRLGDPSPAPASGNEPTAYGATGSGTSPSADQAAFVRMMAIIEKSRSAAPTGKLDYGQFQSGAVIEPGIYDAGGLVINGGAVRLVARIPGTVVIRIPAGQYFLTAGGKVNAVQIDGITFVGGKGAVRFTNAGENVALIHSFSRNLFLNYTECAISDAAFDHPYLRVRDNVFVGAAGASTVGVSWGGELDDTIIEGNAFLRDAYHLILGPGTGDWYVRNNDFISFGGTPTRADIWIRASNKPNSFTFGAGDASMIEGNKFGNENQTQGSPRILVAAVDPASGTDRATQRPGTQDVGGYGGFSIINNRIASLDRAHAPFLMSYVSEMRQLTWRNNKFEGGAYDYIVQFANPRRTQWANTNSDFEFTLADMRAGEIGAIAFSNAQVGTLRDYAGQFPGDPNAVEVYPASAEPGLTLAGAGLSASARSLFGGASRTPAPDLTGAPNGDAVTVSGGAAMNGVYMNLHNVPAAGGIGFMSLGIGKAAGRGLSSVIIEIANPGDNTLALHRRIWLSGRYGQMVTPFQFPASAHPQGWQMRVYGAPGAAVAGSGDTFLTGDWIVNMGPARMARALAARGGH